MNFRSLFNFNNKILVETAWSFLTKGLSFIFFIGINIVIARHLIPEDLGKWAFYFSFLTIISTFSYLGLNGSTQKFLAEHNLKSTLKSVLVQSLFLRIISSTVIVLIISLIFKHLLSLIGKSDFENLIFFSLVYIYFISFNEFFKASFFGLHTLKFNFIINFFEFFFKFVFLLLFSLVFNLNIYLILVAFASTIILSSLVGLIIYLKKIYSEKTFENINIKNQIISYSFPLWFISLGFLLLTEVDTFMLGILSTPSETGYYNIAKQLITKLPEITLALSAGVLPIFAKINMENKSLMQKKLNFLLGINFVIFIFLIIILFFISPYLIRTLFGSEYLASVMPLRILLPFVFFYSFSVLLSGFLDYVGKAKKRAINLSLTMILNVVLNIFLIPKFGANGAAVATLISYFPYVIMNWLEVRKTFVKNYTETN